MICRVSWAETSHTHSVDITDLFYILWKAGIIRDLTWLKVSSLRQGSKSAEENTNDLRLSQPIYKFQNGVRQRRKGQTGKGWTRCVSCAGPQSERMDRLANWFGGRVYPRAQKFPFPRTMLLSILFQFVFNKQQSRNNHCRGHCLLHVWE